MQTNNANVSSKSLIRIATVEQIEDNLETAASNSISRNSFGRRIKVRLHEDDQQLNANDLPWAWPLLPKHLQITPKVGEEVLIFFQDLDGAMGNRFYMGPIISQDYYLDHGGRYEALSLMRGISTKPLCHPAGNPKNDGTYPDQNTIAIQGRGDAAMWLKDEELRLMCGHKPYWNRRSTVERADPGSLEFNKKNLSYIQMKYDEFNGGEENGGFNSAINVVADRINLVTHNGANKKSYLNVTDQKDLMTKESIEKFSKDGQRMVFGDELISFLEKFRQIFAEHVHPWGDGPQVVSAKDTEFWSKNLEELLCKTIRIA